MKQTLLLLIALLLAATGGWAQKWTPSTVLTYSVAYSVPTGSLQDNRGLAVSNDGLYLYLGYNTGTTFRRVLLSSGAVLGGNTTDRAKSIAVDDLGRVYQTGPDGNPIKICSSDLTTLQQSIPMAKCEGIAVKRESGNLYLYATERGLGTVSRFLLTETAGIITAATLNGLDGDGVVSIPMVSGGRGLTGVTVDADGTLYISDPGNGTNGRINRINNDGSGLTTIALPGAVNPYYMIIISGQLFVTEGAYGSFPTRVAVINLSDLSLEGFITPDWSELGITSAAPDMVSGIAALPDGSGFYVTHENGSVGFNEPIIKVSFPLPPAPVATIAAPTSSVCNTYDFPVTVKDFKQVGAISLVMNYEAAVLAYTGVTLNPVISGAASNAAIAGQFRLGFFSNTGKTLADDEVLFTLHFSLIPFISGATTNLTWSTEPGECEFTGPGGEPVYVGSFIDQGVTIPARPVKNTTTGLEYCTIQEAIDDLLTNDAPGDHDVITVAAGNYYGEITVNKKLTIRGAKYLTSGCDVSRGTGESILYPLSNIIDPYSTTATRIVLITVNDVIFEGFTVDGDNPSQGGIGNYNACYGISAESGQANLDIKNNIVKNLPYVGIYLCNDAGGAMSSGNQVRNNKLDNMSPETGFGIGVYTGNNTYADIKDNCMTNVRSGIQGGENNSLANTGNVSPVWSGNTVTSFKVGIWNNLAYGSASPVNITGNFVYTMTGSAINSGIKISSIGQAASVNVTGNTVGAATPGNVTMAGINLWNNPTNTSLAIGSNTYINCNYGIFANNFDGYNSNANSSSYLINGGTITSPLLAGIYVKDNSSNSNDATVEVKVAGTTINGTATGMKAFLLEGGGASLIFTGSQPQATVTDAPKYFVLQTNTVDVPQGNIDATQVLLDGAYGLGMSLSTLFATEDKIDHKIDYYALGFVLVKALNDYVTTGSWVAPESFAKIQRGIDAAGATGWTVNVGPGNFDCSMDITKAIQVHGQGPANTFVDRSANAAAGDIVYIHNLTGDVLVDAFTIKTGPASALASNGVMFSGLTGPGNIVIKDNEIWGVQTATQTAQINYGLIAGYFTVTTPKLVFDNNKVFGGSDNPILIEKWMGPTEITNNFLYQNPLKDFSASDVIFMMNYGGSHNTQKQLISGNTIDMGWGTTNQRGAGISVASSYTGGTPLGGFTDVAISNNILLNLKPNRRGISTWNNSSNGTGGDITNAVISGNAISNAEGLTGEFGIRVLGKATGTQIANNLISGVIDAVLIQPYNTHEATTTSVNNNSLLATTGYGIKNTTTATIAGTCNWYGTTVSAAIAAKIFGPVTFSPWLTSGGDGAGPGFQPTGSCDGAPSVTGTFKYYNTPLDQLSNATPVDLKLMQGSVEKGSTTTTSGTYTFTNVLPGTYDVVTTTTRTTVGGINATDAAQVNYWGTGSNSYSIEKVRFFAGDVDNLPTPNHELSSNDAAMIQGYFLTAGTSGFARSPWTFWKAGDPIIANPGSGYPQITVGSSNITQDFYGLVTGDFNGSYTGTKSAAQNLDLIYGENTLVSNNAGFELPVTAESSMQVGAVSMIMDFPADQVSVEGVYLKSNRTVPVQYAVLGNELRISWYSNQPVSVKAGESLVTLKLRTLGSASQEDIRFILASNPLNELADGNYQVIRNAELRIGVVKANSLPIDANPLSNLLALANYPNPFSGVTSFAYTLPVKGKVILEIRDMLGRKVKEVMNQPQTAGYHSFMMNSNTMSSGLYFATIRLITDNTVLTQTIKIVNNK